MPQLDFLILGSQFLFVVIFFFCYFYFLRKLLPYLTFYVKKRNRIYLAYLKWFSRNIITKETIKEKTYISVLLSVMIKHICTHCMVYYDTPRDYFFGLYRDELIYVARRIAQVIPFVSLLFSQREQKKNILCMSSEFCNSLLISI